ncbi:hypothetical protein FH022_15135 [Listeria monocytogenes]|nr:hypothetical protein [Listeria monocytogenes]
MRRHRTGKSDNEDRQSQCFGTCYYDTKSGRFVQQDTYLGDTQSPASQNRYAYTMNNPINASDPSGHKASKAPPTRKIPGQPSGKKCLKPDGKTLYDCDDTPSISKPGGGGTPLSNGGADGGYGFQKHWEDKGYESGEQVLAREAAADKKRTEELTNEAKSKAKAKGLNIDGLLDGLEGEALLRRVIEIIKLCDAIDAGTLNLNEAQARADSLSPISQKDSNNNLINMTQTIILTIDGITFGSIQMAYNFAEELAKKLGEAPIKIPGPLQGIFKGLIAFGVAINLLEAVSYLIATGDWVGFFVRLTIDIVATAFVVVGIKVILGFAASFLPFLIPFVPLLDWILGLGFSFWWTTFGGRDWVVSLTEDFVKGLF